MRCIKKELAWLGANLSAAGLGAFLGAMGCVLLWVSGGSGWYAVKAVRRPLPPLVLLFVLSLLAGGFLGASAALVLRHSRECCKGRGRGGRSGQLVFIGAAYLFGLGWYAVFFCTRMCLFAAVLLAAALLISALAAAGLIRNGSPPFLWIALIPAWLIDLYLFFMTLPGA